MKLLALHLTNVRKFTAKRASITGIGDGITVISEANEFGKSTFFDAIHALFYEKYNSSAKPVKSLRPYAKGAVEVAAEVATDQGIFRVEKRFLSAKSARITRLSDGVTIAQDDEAERWIATLLGDASDGPAGLLWVRQGQLGLEPEGAAKKEQSLETRRDLLSSVAGEIDAMTGGRRMDRVMRRVAENLSEIATKTGLPTGAWKAANDAVNRCEAELAEVTTQTQILDAALTKRKQVEAAARRLDDPNAKARRDAALTHAKAAMELARSHAGVIKAAEQDRNLAQFEAQNAQTELDRILRTISVLKDAQIQAKESLTKADEAARRSQKLKNVFDAAKAKQLTATQKLRDIRTQLNTLRHQITARKAKLEATQRDAQIEKAQTALVNRDAALAVVRASSATAEWLQQAEDAQAAVANLTAAFEAQATVVNMTYASDRRITYGDATLAPDHPVALEGSTIFELPGLGQMTIQTQANGDDAAARVKAAQAALDDLLSQTGAKSLQAARTFAAARGAAETKADLAQTILDMAAPDGIDALRAANADAQLAAIDAHDDPLPTIADLEAQLVQAETTETDALEQLRIADADHSAAREAAAAMRANANAAAQILEQAKANAGPVETQNSAQKAYLKNLAVAEMRLQKCEDDLQNCVAKAPDLDTTTAELDRAKQAVSTAAQSRTQLEVELATLTTKIRASAGNAIEERRDELTGALTTLRADAARFSNRAAALAKLQAALSAERNAARDTYFGPVQEELAPLLSILYTDAALNFDDENLLPNGLTRAASTEDLDDLSGGTREQIAILTRLAFARLFARRGRHMPIILDDALVYSDDDRIIKMFTALNRVAQNQQIIVFSCRQLAFQDLGGTRPVLKITDL